MLSESVQNYLKAIYALREDGTRATTNALAERLGVAAAHRVDHQIFQPPIHHQRRRLATANLVQNQNAALHSCLQTG